MENNLPAIALDVGQARIGLAACDAEGRFVFGRGYLIRSDIQSDLEAIKKFFIKENAKSVIIGLPLRTDGADSAQTIAVRALADELRKIDLPVIFQDERFSTYLAHQNLGHNRKIKREKGKIDEESAIMILRTYLDRLKNQMSST